jgi:uncharacterized membrane protein YeaQ/YmgE (transglycosylase-associated protein family)
VQILGLIIIGIVIGVIARLVLPGKQHIGALMTILLGIVGALIGGIVASVIGTGDIFELNIIGTLVGIAAAAGLIGVAESAGIGRGGTRGQLGTGR